MRFVDAKDFPNRYANTLRDVLKDVPGVYVQERYGQELRLSVRGSGISRGFHLRGIEVLQDGIPFNLADGSGDFYQIDPLALRSVEVYKGGNALHLRGDDARRRGQLRDADRLDGDRAEHPAHRRAAAFGTIREQLPVLPHLGTGRLPDQRHPDALGRLPHPRAQRTQNFNANLGYRLAPGVETRFYAGVYLTDQKLPGTLTLSDALNNPTLANPAAISGNQSRNVETERIANRTTLRAGRAASSTSTAGRSTSALPPDLPGDRPGRLDLRHLTALGGHVRHGGLANDLVVGGALLRRHRTRRCNSSTSRAQRGAQTLNSVQSASNLEAYGENRSGSCRTSR